MNIFWFLFFIYFCWFCLQGMTNSDPNMDSLQWVLSKKKMEYVTLNTILSGAFCATINLALRGVHNRHKNFVHVLDLIHKCSQKAPTSGWRDVIGEESWYRVCNCCICSGLSCWGIAHQFWPQNEKLLKLGKKATRKASLDYKRSLFSRLWHKFGSFTYSEVLFF